MGSLSLKTLHLTLHPFLAKMLKKNYFDTKCSIRPESKHIFRPLGKKSKAKESKTVLTNDEKYPLPVIRSMERVPTLA